MLINNHLYINSQKPLHITRTIKIYLLIFCWLSITSDKLECRNNTDNCDRNPALNNSTNRSNRSYNPANLIVSPLNQAEEDARKAAMLFKVSKNSQNFTPYFLAK